MTDAQLRRLQAIAAPARADREPDNIVYLPSAQAMELDVQVAVQDAMDWLRDNPGRHYLDAAYAMANRAGSELGRAKWPAFVGALREAAEPGPAAEIELEAER